MIEFSLASADGTGYCVYQRWFLEVFLGPVSNVNDRIMPMSDAVSSDGPKTIASNKSLRPCPLHTEISPVSLNLFMMLCTVHDEICKSLQFEIQESIPQYFYTLFHRLESLCPSLLLKDSASLRHPFYG